MQLVQMWCFSERENEKVLIVLPFPREGLIFKKNIFKSFNLIFKEKQMPPET